ncbi:cardiolipin synthase [Micrococcoides hystricis]|uniref:Cardiolipin synthase n=1 Tax=Micrococcoides hystricis TaxID=1572761 RepID=A0ABV6PCZ6_9MICC
MGWPITLTAFLPEWAVAVLFVLELAVRVLMLGIIPGNRRPTTAMAWLLLIFFVPLPGIILFLLFGTYKLSNRRREAQQIINDYLRENTEHLKLPDEASNVDKRWLTAVHLNHDLTGFPMLDGNELEFITDYRAVLKRIAEDIDNAKEYVNIEFYILGWDEEVAKPVYESMAAAAERGVKVRLLFDHLGTMRTSGYRTLLRYLNGTKIHVRKALPLQPLRGLWRRFDLRNHRKIVVIDGDIGYTGSQNLIEPGYNRAKSHKMGREWVEIMARCTGPIVSGLNVAFASDWLMESDASLEEDLRKVPPAEVQPHGGGGVATQVVPSGPGYATENNLRLFNTLIYAAQERVRIVTPYFVPDDTLLYAVTIAVQQGVEVELFVSEQSDQMMVSHAQQSYYQALLEAGVNIYRYPVPDILHAKILTVDGEVSVFGSSNMDMRSFSLNLEISVMALGETITGELDKIIDSYKAESPKLSLDEWENRSPRTKWLDNVFRLTATIQ